MCLFIKPKCKIEIAEGPITVFKLISKKSNDEWMSYCQKTVHKYNEVLETVEHLTKDGINDNTNTICGYSSITLGFHAYVNNSRAQEIYSKLSKNKNLDIMFAVIPRGAEYCLGLVDEIVSNKMIVFSSKEKLDEYLKCV